MRALILLLAFWVALPTGANQPIDAGQCLSICLNESDECSRKHSHQTLCSDHKLICVNRCDPRLQHRASTELLFPTSGRVVDEPRHKLSHQDRNAICSQNCDLGKDSCIRSGNDSTLCSETRKNCLLRCEASMQ